MRASGALRRIVLWSVAGLIVLTAAWIAATAIVARRDGQHIEAELRQVETLVAQGRLDEAKNVASDIPSRASRAHELTTGPAWWVVSHVPWAGRPLEIVRGTTLAANEIGAHGVPTLLQVASSLDPTKLRTAGDTVNLAPLISAAPRLAAAADTLHQAIRTVDHTPSNSWLNAADKPRQVLGSELTSIGGYVDAAARAAKILPTMLGQNGPKRYFIGLQNEAEMRGTGGLPGAFAIVVANHGKVSFTHFESDDALLPPGNQHQLPTGLNFGAQFDAAYGSGSPTSLIVNSNVSPQFPYAAQVWAAMWQKVSGEHVDGAIALDPTVLSGLLAATGPVLLPDDTLVDANTVVSLTERDQYAQFSDNTQRKAFEVSVLKAVSTHLTKTRNAATPLARAIGKAASDQRLMVWSSDRAVQSVIMQTNYAGAIPTAPGAFAGPILNNEAAGKLDFYTVRTMTYHRSGCGSTRDVIVTITLTNKAPAYGLPAYVTTRLDDQASTALPEENRSLLDYYATPGSQLLSVTLNQQPTTAGALTFLGHPVYRMDLELPRGKTQTIVLHLQEPATKGPVQIWRQPGVTPITVAAYAQPCK
jgi:hypothetical protein